VIFRDAVRPIPAYNLFVRRLVPSLLLVVFAAALHASVPAVRQTQFIPAETRVEQAPGTRALPITAAPADRRSFFSEFYSTEPLPAKPARKSGLLHRFTTVVKKTVQKVNFFD
jgi:hypothetical protein